MAARLSTLHNHITLTGGDHGTFQFGNQPDYFNLLLEEITTTEIAGSVKSVQLDPKYTDYPRFAAIMARYYPSHSWEPLKVLSGPEGSSKYELTTFHVWNEEKRDESLGPVFFQHGGL